MIPNWLEKFYRWWGANTTLQTIANGFHALIALSSMLFFPRVKWELVVFWLAFGAWKEFWFDLRYEPPDVSGGIKGGLEDYAGYAVGTGLGILRLTVLIPVLAFPQQAATCTYLLHGTVELPDAVCTPGVVRTIETQGPEGICTTSTKKYRHTTAEMKHQVCVAYGVKPCPHAGTLEIDHLLPLEIGGADDVKNLWPQQAPQFHWKDRLENFVHAEVCSGKMDVKEAQTKMANDWYAFYLELHCDKFCEGQ